MDVYYFVILVTLFLCYIIKIPDGDEKAYLRKVICVFTPIMLFGALRKDFGIDYHNYEEWYYEWQESGYIVDEDLHAEIGYQWLSKIMPSWRLLLIFVSTSVVGAYIMSYYKYVEPNYLILAMVFTMFYPDQSFFLSFVSMRNGLTIAGTLFCLPLIIERKYWIVLLITLGLMQFHTSVFLFLPLAFVVGRNVALTKKEVYIWIGVFLFLSVVSTSELLSFIEPFIVGDRFESYKTNYLINNEHASFLNGIANFIIFCFIISWAYRNRETLTKSQNTIWRISLLYILCPFLGSIGRTRMIYYYIPFYIITITYIMNDQWRVNWHKVFFFILILAVMCYATFVVWMNNPYFVYEHYHSIIGDLF